MRLITWIYAILALAVCAWLALNWRNATVAEPRALLDEARRSIGGPEADNRRALSQLGLALEAAETARDLPLVEEILTTRARLLRSTGGFTQARADLERVLTHFRPGAPAIEALLASVDLEAGAVEPALARATAVLAKDRNQSEAWGVRAEALVNLAEQRLEACRAHAGLALAEKGLDTADALMRRIAARDSSDPERARLVDELYEAFPAAEKHRAREVLDELDDASRLLADVPEALAESFRGAVRRDTVLAYMKLLRDAGEIDMAVDFGLAVSKLPALATYPPFLRALMETLVDARRLQAAAEVVDPGLGRRAAPDAGFFALWARVLYRAESWRVLPQVANLLRAAGDPNFRSMASFYTGVAQARIGQNEQAQASLQRYLLRGPVEPFDGAVAIGWQALAQVERALGKPDDELAALRRRTTLAPDRYPGVAEAWLRRSELAGSMPPVDRLEELDDLTQALRLAPERRVELEPRWRELGQRIATAQRVDVAAECDALLARGLSTPDGKRTSYELVAMSEELLARGEYATAGSLAQRALDTFPDLLPALEVFARATAGSRDYAGAAQLYRRRLTLGGPDPRLIEELVALPLAELGPQWELELVRLDPEGFGRRCAAERLRERGDIGQAVAGLQRVAPERLGEDGLLTLAQLLYDQGHDERAQAELARLPADLRVLAKALPLALDIGVRQRDAHHLSALLALLDARVPVDLEALIGCVDHMLVAGMVESARELVQALDARSRYRCAPLYLRLAQIELLSGNLDAADEALERALPYDESGASELGSLILAVERRRWSELPALARELDASAFEPSPLQYVALAALAERLGEARLAVEKSRAELPEETLWPLLDAALAALGGEARAEAPGLDAFARAHGFGAGADGALERDPRPLLARVVALAQPDWSAWAVADLERQRPPANGALWPMYLAALGDTWLGHTRDGEQLAREISAAWPTFAPAWDLVQEAIEAEVKRPDHPRLVRLAEQRRAALGDEPGRAAERLQLEARELEAAGDLDGALRLLDRACGLEPVRPGVLRRKAQLHRRRHEWNAAIAAFQASLARVRDETDSHPVAEYVELLDEACAADPAALEHATRTALDELAARLPEDPLVALALARRNLPQEPHGGRLDSAAAVNVLDDFRRRTAGRSLDELREGSAAQWADFYAAFDPLRAYQHVQAELALEPASVELWRKLSELARRLGRLDEAVTAAETATRMLPDPLTARALAGLYAQRGDDIGHVRAQVAEAARIAGTSVDDRPLALALARALVHGDKAQLDEGLAALKRLWDSRDAAQRPEELVEVGTLYGLALCRRGDGADRPTTQSVLKEVAPRVEDRLQRSLLLALSSISRYVGL